MNILTDLVLPYHLLKFCVESYRHNYTNEEDPFISPICISDKVLKELPPVRIIVGSSDPLRDDAILFLNRLVKLNKNVKLTELKYFPHGFLNYDYPLMMPEASVANEIMIEQMEEFIKN